MVVLEFAIFPMDQGENLSAAVARAMDIIDKSGVTYQMTPMGTVLEGEWEDVMAVVNACMKDMQGVSDRVYLAMKADYRKGKSGRLKSKIQSVEKVLGRELSS